MITVDTALCSGCGLCAENCPLKAITMEEVAVIGETCVRCGLCERICPCTALAPITQSTAEEVYVSCDACPVQCTIKPGFTGACRRYINLEGILQRNRTLVLAVPETDEASPEISRPLLTAVGAGSTYPCCRPAPHIVQDSVNGVDVVTVVTEAPLSYSGVKIKVDTNFYIGAEGAKVRREGVVVGMLETEEYGSKMIAVGGANILTGKHGSVAARTIVEVSNGERVTLNVDNGALLELQVGHAPVINGKEDKRMRVGCGSATIGMFASQLAAAVDEAIILDHHIVGLLSEHRAGKEAGLGWSGVVPNARLSTPGRYFGEPGGGWGGTNIEEPRQAIRNIDSSVARPGIKILVTETTGRQAALFTLDDNRNLQEIPLTQEAGQVVELIAASCEEAKVSALYFGGTGGSARAGVAGYPLELTKAVHRGEATLTIGGAPTFILPGGGINFRVDVERVAPKAFTWVPTPATVAPVEYTMSRARYEEIGGHTEQIVELSVLREKMKGREGK
ncbi:MAG: 4Fe-4S binding protein [Dethiobacter sp.]|jgi:ferredoxin|nr:4Fe-4S binding protein [Dethiobacter sp.]